MKQKMISNALAVLLAGAISLPGTAGADVADGPGLSGRGAPGGRGPGASQPAAAGLSQEEQAGLNYMYAEEQLARDVYAALAARWGVPIFANISRSEQTHLEAVGAVLEAHGLAAPAQRPPAFQALYEELVVRGEASLTEAYRVGMAIEELDIADLEARLALTDQVDLERLYGNLRRGSNNHLRAFTGALDGQSGMGQPSRAPGGGGGRRGP